MELPLASGVSLFDPASFRSAMHKIFSFTVTGTGAPPDISKRLVITKRRRDRLCEEDASRYYHINMLNEMR